MYPDPTDKDYCPSSKQPIPDYEDTPFVDLPQWHRCPSCNRPIAAMPNGRFFPHVSNIKRARRRDQVQESLISYGLNLRTYWH